MNRSLPPGARGLATIVGFLVVVELASGVLQGYYTPIFSDIADHLGICRDAANRDNSLSRSRSTDRVDFHGGLRHGRPTGRTAAARMGLSANSLAGA